jgi:hypothetical protein
MEFPVGLPPRRKILSSLPQAVKAPEALSDIRAPDDDTLAADLIVNWVRRLPADRDSALALSIACEVKPWDSTRAIPCCVMGAPRTPFEGNPEFYDPTIESRAITSEAVVTSPASLRSDRSATMRLKWHFRGITCCVRSTVADGGHRHCLTD